MPHSPNRRQFIRHGSALTAAATATALARGVAAAPFVHTTRRGANSDTIIGEGQYRYRVNHRWLELPERYQWQTTHNVAVDSKNQVYVIHEGRAQMKEHPSIFVFDEEGKFVRAFGGEFQGGGHGIEVRQEGSEEFLYVAAYQGVKSFAKLTLTGDIVWYQKAPMESGKYAPGESTSTKANWSRNGFLPTNFAFLDDGGFLLADGYGSYFIHRYDKEANWVSCFGGPGSGEGKFQTAHGLWIDDRGDGDPTIVVTDRAHHTLQRFTMDGEYLETHEGFGLPANVDTRGNLMLIPELKARVSLLDEKNEVVAQLGSAVERLDEIKQLRTKPDQWRDGEFVHPHDACFDREGNILVAEWVATGRVTKLTPVDG